MRNRWRVAVLDSGLAHRMLAVIPPGILIAARRFSDDGREVVRGPTISDPIGHGTAVAEAICGASDTVELLIAQVLDDQGVTTAATVAAAIDWAVESGADLIHMSLGLREDRRVLRMAVDAAASAGRIVVASTPARGERTFPSSYPQVIRATGDARCQPDEISFLGSSQADFGGCPRRPQPMNPQDRCQLRAGGASLGAAHVSGFLVGRVAPGSGLSEVRERLTAMARHHGIERKPAPATADTSAAP